MPKVAADNSPLLERAIFGYDGTNYRVVKVDTDGNLVAAVKAAQTIEVTQDVAADLLATVDIAAAQTIEVTQDTAADLLATVDLAADQNVQARSHGWIAAAWQKQPMLLGYSATLQERKSNLAAVAGTNALTSTSVPTGQVWVVNNMSMIDPVSAITGVLLVALSGDSVVALKESGALAANTYVVWGGSLVLGAGDYMVAYFLGCTAGDDIYFDYQGYKVDVDQ